MKFGRTVAFTLMIAAMSPAAAQPVSSVGFDCMVDHEFAGFGLNVWPLPRRLDPLLSLLSDLNAKFVRWKMLPDLEKAEIPEGTSFNGLVDWIEGFGLTQGRVMTEGGFSFFRRLQSLGFRQVAASWSVPEVWRNHRPALPAGSKIHPIAEKHIGDYGRLLAAQLRVLQRHGSYPQAIELLNEPVTKIAPQQYSRLVSSFRSWLSVTGSPEISVAGPGAVFTWGNPRYLHAVASEGGKLDIASTHVWDSLRTRRLGSLSPLILSVPAGWATEVFVTEYGIDLDRWYQPPYTAGPQQQAGERNAVDDIPFGVATAAQTLALLSGGANAVFYWEAQDPPWSKQQWGLLSKDDRRRPAVDALRTVVRPLQVGDNIVASPRREEALPAMLVARPTQLVLQIANPTPERQDYDITFRNCTVGPISVTRSEAWPAGREVEMRTTSDPGLRVTMPGDTVVSITTSR